MRLHVPWHRVEVREQLCGVGPLLPPFRGFRGSNPAHQAFYKGLEIFLEYITISKVISN